MVQYVVKYVLSRLVWILKGFGSLIWSTSQRHEWDTPASLHHECSRQGSKTSMNVVRSKPLARYVKQSTHINERSLSYLCPQENSGEKVWPDSDPYLCLGSLAISAHTNTIWFGTFLPMNPLIWFDRSDSIGPIHSNPIQSIHSNPIQSNSIWFDPIDPIGDDSINRSPWRYTTHNDPQENETPFFFFSQFHSFYTYYFSPKLPLLLPLLPPQSFATP